MATTPSPLRVIPLGGIGDMGKNMTVFEQNDELLIVDCGLMFPDVDRPGVDLVIPDMTYVLENAERVVGVVLTHGHEDHIGSLPFLLEQMPAIVWGTPLTLGLLENRLAEFRPQEGYELVAVEAGETINVGSFKIQFIRINHSVRDGVGLAIHTEQGVVFHTGDFKFDQTPVDGVATDFQSIANVGAQDALLLLCDCTNVERSGMAGSERGVGQNLRRIFAESEGRVFVTCFASHIARIEQVFEHAHAAGRRVAVAGRSMIRNIQTAQRLGMINIPPGVEIPLDVAADCLPREVAILASGSQGEPLSALTRMSTGGHKWVEIEEGDTVIISARAIPGNERSVLRNIDNIYRCGARVIYGNEDGVHVSGHAHREEIRLMLNLIRPKYSMPIHGDYRHLALYRDLCVEMGWKREDVLVMEGGEVLEFNNQTFRKAGSVPYGALNVDGLGVGDVGDVVIGDRHALAEDGIVLPVLALDAVTGEVVGGPEIYSRGFVYMNEAEDIIEDLRDEVYATWEKMADEGPIDPELLYARLRTTVGKRIAILTGRRPMIVPVLIPINELEDDELDAEDEENNLPPLNLLD